MHRILKLLRMMSQRNIRIMFRYRLNFFIQIINTLLFAIGALIFFDLIGQTRILEIVGTKNYISFLLLGIAVGVYVNSSLFGSSNGISGELISGQVEYIFSCPVSRYWYVAATAFAQTVVATFSFIPLLLLAFYFSGVALNPANILLASIETVVELALLLQLGIVFAGFALVYKQISAAFGVLNMVFLLFSGTFFPLEILPRTIQMLSLAVPTTTGIDLLRHYLLNTFTIVPLLWEWLALLIELPMFTALAIVSIRYLEKSWKENGLSYI